MKLPNIPQVILTDDEIALYALMGERFQRRRRIDLAIFRLLALVPAVVVLMAVLLEVR